MGRGDWRATAHGVAELDMTQKLRHTHTHTHTHTQETTANEKPFHPDVTRKESKREKGLYYINTQRNYNNYSKMAEV